MLLASSTNLQVSEWCVAKRHRVSTAPMLAADLHLVGSVLWPQFVQMTVFASPQSNAGMRLEAACACSWVWRCASPIDVGKEHAFTT